ncbi:MAG: hypothetical protein AAF297_10235 [Planctomycetota bacterium]
MHAPNAVTWSALLGKWTDFAKAGLALPTDGDGGRWRRCIAPAIGLQAVTYALGELDQLESADERAAGLDRAGLLIANQAKEIHEVWSGEPLPRELTELIADARLAAELAASTGVEWTVAAPAAEFDHGGTLAATLVQSGFAGDLYLPAPGIPLFAGSVAAFARAGRGGGIDLDTEAVVSIFLGIDEGLVEPPHAKAGARQVYRQFDFASGGPVRDVIAPLAGEPLAGQPLLIAAILDGEPQPIPLPPKAGKPIDPLPVVEHDPER